MSFFDKFFTSRNRHINNETPLKSETDRLWSSHLSFSKDQIRFILFRECDKRGRKLLFDSNSVEKVILPTKESMCNLKSQLQNEKISDFIETNKTHGYKYKKPSSDVLSLGEMVFGSVAVVYKGENSYKIHSIPSPKRLMFTTIVNAPFRYSGNAVSDLNLSHLRKSSVTSLSDVLNQQMTSSSDSKLYSHEGITQKYSSTYPWIKQSFPVNRVKQSYKISNADCSLTKKSFLNNSNDLRCLENLCLNKRTKDAHVCLQGKISSEKFFTEGDQLIIGGNNLCLYQRNSDCEGEYPNTYDISGTPSNESENFSSVSSSLSSLRRRWIHSYSTSLDSKGYDDSSGSGFKKKTKLGMALVVDLSNTLESEIEKLLLNHTIVVDSAMSKLQACVELAYIRNENFVDLIHTAFLECQQNIYELITGGKYEIPMWFLKDSDGNMEVPLKGLNPNEKNMSISKKQDLVNNIKLKFLIDFYDVLAKFDTKDTNFFISTLLTAILTHHLSWVTSIAETDLKSPTEKLTVINSTLPYNPIWAQMNDLCGLLGSPLKSVKTVVTGSKSNQLGAIVQVLSYFIRCNNVAENIYEVDIEDVIGNVGFENTKGEFDSIVEFDGKMRSMNVNFEKQCFDSQTAYENETERYNEQKIEENLKKVEFLLKQADFNKVESEAGLKRSKSYLSQTRLEEFLKFNELYPDIRDLAKIENVNIADLNQVKNEHAILVENFLNNEKLHNKNKVPNKNIRRPAEVFISLDKGYDTIDSTKTLNLEENRVQIEKQRLTPEDKRGNIVFLLGENEELINLQKTVYVNKSSFVDMEKEDSRELPPEKEEHLSDECAIVCADVSNLIKSDRNSWTLECGTGDGIFRVNSPNEKLEESYSKVNNQDNVLARAPWIFHEIPMPRITKPCLTRRLEVASVMGGVNEHYNSEQIIQGVLKPKDLLEEALQKDLLLCARNPVLEKDVVEALCIVGDMNSWEVSLLSSNLSETLNRNKQSGIRIGMSQLVADMLESFQYLHMCNLSPSFCLDHIEAKLREIYLKSKAVAELLTSTELCSIDYLTSKLDIGINDVPLLLSVATTHSPHITEKYVLSFS